jgi:hypothetical protein
MRNQLAACTLIAALLGASLATPALAQGRGRGRGQDTQDAKQDVKQDAKQDQRVAVRNGFPARDRDLITRYYTRRAAGLPPGLAKRQGDLPPGLEKQLQRNGTLPPGLQKKIQPFPADLDRQLPRPPAGFRRVIVDDDVIIYRVDAKEIVDIIYDVVR